MGYGIEAIREQAAAIAKTSTLREQLMLSLLEQGASYSEIAKENGITRQRVCQILERAAQRSGLTFPQRFGLSAEDYDRARTIWGKPHRWPKRATGKKGVRRTR